MSKKKTTEEFILEAKKIHGDKYDYSKVEYNGKDVKVCIICSKHGEFWQSPHCHLSGYGCQKCASENAGQKNKLGLEEFIKRAKEKHGDKYDYSKVIYTNCSTPVIIGCPIHGEFKQTPMSHLVSNGCPKCSMENGHQKRRLNNIDFVKKIKFLYGDKFIYDKTNFINTRTKLILTCPKHGDFFVNPNFVFNNCECPQCKKEAKIFRKKQEKTQKINRDNEKAELKKQKLLFNQKEFIEKATGIHGDKYDYSKVEYLSRDKKVCIICPEHGEFWQRPAGHLSGCNCPMCAREMLRKKNSFNNDIFIERAKEIHGNKYDYSKVNYINNRIKITIGCPIHGDFEQMPSMHINERQGCPLCGTLSSKDECDVLSYIKSIYDGEIIQREHKLISPKELDIYIPDKKIAIEFNGLRWHCELFDNNKYKHLNKLNLCNKKGIKLIQIFEDEWKYKKEICKSKLSHLLCCENKEKIMARKCNVKEIDFNESSNFLNKYHIQGQARGTVHLGCFYNDNLIAVMVFIKEYKEANKWELNRFASNYDYICQGVGSKMFKYFIQNYGPDEIKSFADRRWTINEDNNIYLKLGFNFNGFCEPDYSYVTSKNSYKLRLHKFNFRKKILHKKYGFPLSMTESEMIEKLHYYKIWNCGLIKYIWKKENTVE